MSILRRERVATASLFLIGSLLLLFGAPAAAAACPFMGGSFIMLSSSLLRPD